jgi:long-chain acyl-CoA synthetase
MNVFDYFFEHTQTLNKNFVVGPKETISYAALYSRCIILADYLKQRVGKDQNIILIAPNSVFLITAYLAILKSDNIAVPLNPEIEQSNLDFIQNKCRAGIVFTTPRLAKKLRIEGAMTLDEIALNEIMNSHVPSSSHSGNTPPAQLAEIIFTSGSTGEPKGVMISHKNLIANTSSIVEYLKLTERDTMLVVLPFYYCYGLSLLHTHLRVGGSIVLNNMFIMLGSVINDLKQFNCTGFAGVPTHFQILLRKSNSFKTTHFDSLKYVTQAGGKLHNAFINEFINALPNIKFIVMYGQTEATARLSWLSPEKLPEKIGSCGKGIPGVELRVFNDHGKPIQPGEIGEIVARGDNIMLGYYKDEQSTRQTIKDGWLHTGDLATIDEDGFLFLTARKKEIIKVGGRRISPKEIEDVIVSMSEVIDCSIVGLNDDILGETMKATIVIKESSSVKITSDDIKKYCAERLATYKIPQIIELKSEITISATGKKIKK